MDKEKKKKISIYLSESTITKVRIEAAKRGVRTNKIIEEVLDNRAIFECKECKSKNLSVFCLDCGST